MKYLAVWISLAIAAPAAWGAKAAANCSADWQAALARAEPGDVVCVADGDYPLAKQQQIVIPGAITFRAETRGGARFIGGGRDWQPVLKFAGAGAVVDGIQILRPTGHASSTASIKSNGEPNRIQNSVLAHSGPGDKNGMPVGLGGGGQLVDSVVFGRGRYTVIVGSSTPGPVLIEGNIIRNDKPWIVSGSEPNAGVQVYGKADVTLRHNIVLDTDTPEGAPADCGDYCIGADIVDGVQIFADNLLMEGNVATHNTSSARSDRCLHLNTKGGGRVANVVIRDFFCSHTRSGISFSDPRPCAGTRYERCTTFRTEKEGNAVACGDDAVIDWNWPNERMAFEAMCDPAERQSGWCRSGLTLKEYANLRE